VANRRGTGKETFPGHTICGLVEARLYPNERTWMCDRAVILCDGLRTQLGTFSAQTPKPL
jgi:hypothetical protein